ncbi:MAG: dUTP diphosphatase [Bacillus sp. (in: firmicutes)]
MNTEKLFALQRAVDQHLDVTGKLDNKSVRDQKLLALLVEVGELVKATDSCQYLDNRRADTEVIRRLYIDGIQYILSVGIEHSYDRDMAEEEPVYLVETVLSVQFLHVYEAVSMFRLQPDYGLFKNLVFQYLHLGKLLGLSMAEIEMVYISRQRRLLKGGYEAIGDTPLLE